MKLTESINHSDSKKILIVDHDRENCSFLRALLSDLYAVTIVGDGKSALEKIESEQDSNVVVLDCRLPDMPGLDVLREIKRRRADIPVILTSAYEDEKIAVKAFRYGAKDYLKKPFNYKELLNTIRFSVSLRSLEKRETRRVLTAEEDETAPVPSERTDNPALKYKLQKALLYIHNNYMSKINLEKVAEKACSSKYHFSREFRKTIGCTYQLYLRKLRMEKAKELLENTDLSVTEVALSVGYADLTNFERIFKKVTGCGPKQYKNHKIKLHSGNRTSADQLRSPGCFQMML